MNLIEPRIGLKTSAPAESGVGAFRCFRSRLLADIVDAIWDLDIPDGDAARALAIKYAPGTCLLLMAQYRAPVLVQHRGRDLPNKCATQIQASSVTLRPTGALGLIVVSLRPEAASRIVDARLGQFANANVHLASLFSRGEVSTCDQMLAAARNSRERIATVEAFLLHRLGPQRDGLACHAASYLRNDPALPLQQLAALLGISVRHLSRTFNATFGMTPKRFGRLARIEKIVAERRNGLSWAEIACACDLADQAHLIREFKDIVGEAPSQFFAREMRANIGTMKANFVVRRAVETEPL
ncbi:MAG TPA: helix-turn-helix domain-containing protein [Hyphomicrobiaceae bacterium]|nr:helix-turn-helix domain-containing protein [Hyphomicrobiaceae bacterium]